MGVWYDHIAVIIADGNEPPASPENFNNWWHMAASDNGVWSWVLSFEYSVVKILISKL